MKVLVFGQTGQVARELALSAPPSVTPIFLGRAQCDLSEPMSCVKAIEAHAPSAVINAAAYTAVDRAESEPELAHLINAEAPAMMAESCKALGIAFLTYSTDYVFSGGGERAWRVDDQIDPQSVYGRSKSRGEEAIMALASASIIMRTSWVFSRHGSNFVKTMLRLGAERDQLSVVCDQIGGPTPAAEIAKSSWKMLAALAEDPSKAGIYHYSGAPNVSWAEFAGEIFSQAGLEVEINPIASSQYPTPARRPLNSRLDCHKTASVFGIEQPDWREGLQEIIDAL